VKPSIICSRPAGCCSRHNSSSSGVISESTIFVRSTLAWQPGYSESREFLNLDPLSSAANLHLAWTYLTDRQSQQAVEQFQKALRMDPNYEEAHHGLARAYLQEGRNEEAVAELQTAAALSRRRCFSTSER
jgi:tetratricopeptide (TPR) repeat protein